MYTLIIEDSHGRPIAEPISFDQGSYTIGRVDGNDIVLPSQSVSRSHARIFVANNKCYIDNLSSTNGVLVNNVPIKERTEIVHGSKIRIGEYMFYLEYKDQSDMNSGQEVLKTQIVSSGQGGYKIVRIQDKFAGEEFMLSEQTNTIGRTEDNYILLSDQSISRNHAKITNHGMIFTVVDLDSSNGTFVNGKKVSNQCQLQPNDIVRFGNVSFVFVPASQRVDITQYANLKTNDNKLFLKLLAGMIVFILIIAVVAGVVLHNKKVESENNAAATAEAETTAKLNDFRNRLGKAETLYNDNQFIAAHEIVRKLQEEWTDNPDPELLELNGKLNKASKDEMIIQEGNTKMSNGEYSAAISKFKQIKEDSKSYDKAQELIKEAKLKNRLANYNKARNQCDDELSPETIKELCNATLELDNSEIEHEKTKETIEFLEPFASNKKSKVYKDAKDCIEQLR
ncbi:MAG: FHA domain-containing protein [Proteobacteria bacterium]|nr:FHA domain-containing protein [Pseudomonadota bacterium]